MDYLGYIISDGSISMDKDKVQCILDWPIPANIKELRGFLGLSGYYRRFIRGYGALAKPLTELLKKNGWGWNEEAETAMKKLKEAIVTAPVLALPDFQKEFLVETDASANGVGAVLIQNGRPLAYFSKGLGVKHQALSIYDKEMLAVLLAVKKWSSYLVGRHFKIRTDHQSLRFLSSNQATTPAQQMWVAKMMGYDFEVCYRKGASNTVADVLSRNPNFSQGVLMAISSFNSDWEERETGKSVVASVDRSLQAREVAIKMLRFYLQRASERMKKQAGKKRSDREFTVQSRKCQKLAPKWFGPFLIVGKVGKVAYKLQLPPGSKVHPIFHVSQLKKHIGSALYQYGLPIVGPDGAINKEPMKILDRRIGKKGNKAVTEVLVEWSNSFPEDATWEVLQKLQMDYPQFNP
ncbi:hypothetical protein GQ457_10G005140 [Hibiscus cannabinus]